MSFDHLFYSANGNAPAPPNVEGTQILIAGTIRKWNGPAQTVMSPIRRKKSELSEGESDLIQIGTYAMCDAETALEALHSAERAYDFGRGEWPRLSPLDRINHVKRFAEAMAKKREEMVQILMWEICKNRSDAEKEVDRTITYIRDTIGELTRMENQMNGVTVEGGIVAQVKRSPLGVSLVAGPMNYPLNEFATLFIPVGEGEREGGGRGRERDKYGGLFLIWCPK